MEYYINNVLCLEFSELVPVIITKDNYDYHRRSNNLRVHGVAGNGRRVLIEFEKLPPNIRESVVGHYGDPYSYASKQPLLRALRKDPKAEAFYMDFTLPNGAKLPSSNFDINGKPQINYVARYVECAEWLNMLTRLTDDKTALKQELNISVAQFWRAAIDLMKSKKVALPKSYKRLTQKVKVYNAEGYRSLVETHKFGNDYGKKIVGDVAEALLKELLSLRNKHADTTVADEYNKWAKQNGLQTITPEAVGYWRKKWHVELMLEREGMGKTYTKLSKHGRRERPTAPLLLVNSDDNVLDLFFRAPGNDWFRPVLYVVIDAFNDYILGYAVGASVTKELVKEAYRDANRHVMQLTGGAYCWHQIQTDRWGISGKNTTDLEQFYHSMGTFTPAGLKNSQAKYVERSFGQEWHKTLKKLFPSNYSGHNLTAKQKLNSDNLKPAYFPNVEDSKAQIAAFIEAMRQTYRKEGEGLSRQAEWLHAFKASHKSQERLLTPEARLQIFGKTHSHLNRIAAGGLTPTLLGKPRVYELSQDTIFNHAGKQVQIVYDEQDLSQVLVTDGKGLRFISREYQLLPSAIADYKDGDRQRINNLLEEKRTLMPKIKALVNDRKAILNRAGIDAESRLQAGVLIKEITHKDQMLINKINNGGNVDNDDEAFDIYADMLK